MPHRWDLAFAAALVTLVVWETLNNTAAPRTELRAALAGLTVAAVAVRRAHPITAAVVFSLGMTAETLATESPDEAGILIAILLVAYAVGAHLPQREALLGAALISFALTIAIATDPSDSVSNVPLSVVLFVGLPFGIGFVIRRRARDVAALTLRTAELELEAEGAVATERRRIARELHDVVSHAVTLIAIQAEAGQAVIDADPARAKRSLAAIGQVSREALDELGRLLAVLDEEEPTSEAGLASLPALVAGVQATGLHVTLDAGWAPGEADPSDGAALEPAVDQCAYRVVQESLTNALRHTAGGRVNIRVRRSPAGLDVQVRSDGRVHTSSYGGSGRGLAGLRERVLSLGGTWEAGPHDGAFVVRAVLPSRA
jgi:signal transduction histidine kinase